MTFEQQIPGGNDRKKGKGKGKGRSRFPEGMTERKARAKRKATAKAKAAAMADGQMAVCGMLWFAETASYGETL